MRQVGHEPPEYRHEALFYRGDEELLAGTMPRILEAVEAEAAVLVAIPQRRRAVLREALGPAAGAVEFADMEEIGRNPGRIIPVWRDFAHRHAADGDGPPALGIGEPIWPERTESELVECRRHETLLNLAFPARPGWTLLCPYDAERLAPEVLAAARRNHPYVADGGGSTWNAEYAREIPGEDPLPDPAGEVATLAFGRSDLRLVRQFLADHAERAGLEGERLADLVLAVDELATNTLRYARGGGTVRTWRENGTLLCEVADGGHIADPLAGRELPAPDALGGRGLYLVNLLCDLVQLRSSPDGSVVRLHMRTPPEN